MPTKTASDLLADANDRPYTRLQRLRVGVSTAINKILRR